MGLRRKAKHEGLPSYPPSPHRAFPAPPPPSQGAAETTPTPTETLTTDTDGHDAGRLNITAREEHRHGIHGRNRRPQSFTLGHLHGRSDRPGRGLEEEPQ